MSGIENDVLVAKNVNFDYLSNPPHSGIVTANGQLLIGSTSDPNIAIVANTLTEGSGISITNGPGTITISLAGGGTAIDSIGVDNGAVNPVLPTPAGLVNVLGAHGINTTGTPNTVTVNINNAITLGDLSAIAAGSNALDCDTGDVNLDSGNLKLPNTSATGPVGLVKLGSTNFLSNLGTSNAFGGGAANLTLTTASATNNTAFGNSCFTAVTTGSQNCAFGNGALNTLQTGGLNCAFGINALNNQNGTSQSSAFGNRALAAMTSGHDNTAVGSTALTAITTGDNNVAVGQNAGSAYTSSESNNICIGRGVTGTLGESAVTRIGAAQTACYIDGIDGVNVGSVATVVTEASDRLGTATITAGSGITVTPSANAITIAASTGGFTWNNVTSTSASMAKQNGYQANNAGLVTLSLPATASSTFGDTIQIAGLGAGGWTISQAAGQQIQFGSSGTTVGVTGSISSTNRYDALELVYSSTAGLWLARYAVGNLTVA